jgi:uncharacterized membrane protein YdjX (TVP38/TMEM64 family)
MDTVASPHRGRHWALPAGLLVAAAAATWLAGEAGEAVRAGCVTAWQQGQAAWLRAEDLPPWPRAALLFGVFVLLSALALPGCSVLALSAGAWFGLGAGTALVVVASTLGATVPFVLARRFGRARLMRRHGERLAWLERALARDGARLLFALRVLPLLPYGLVNPLMGLTAMRLPVFAAVSAAGMLLGSAAYVQAGVVLGRAATPTDLWDAPLAALLAATALLPWLLRRRPTA